MQSGTYTGTPSAYFFAGVTLLIIARRRLVLPGAAHLLEAEPDGLLAAALHIGHRRRHHRPIAAAAKAREVLLQRERVLLLRTAFVRRALLAMVAREEFIMVSSFRLGNFQMKKKILKQLKVEV